MREITAIIVDYKKADKVPRAVESILRQNGDFDVQIVIVNNSSTPYKNDWEENEKVRLISPRENLGYAKGNNLGAKGLHADFLLILNADIKLSDSDSLQKICEYLQSNPDIAILGTKQICQNEKAVISHQLSEETDVSSEILESANNNKNAEKTVRKFPSLLAQIMRRTVLRSIPPFQNIVKKYECEAFDYEKTQEVDWLQSSFWAVRKDFWDDINGFDERYFVFMADTEMCLQAWKRGKKVVYFADVSVEADGIRASEGGFFDFFRKKVLRVHAKDALKYFWKHLFEKNPRSQLKNEEVKE